MAAERQDVMTSPATDEHPPRWAERLLLIVLPRRDRETIPGDLLEEFREVVLPSRGRAGARIWYVRQVLSLVPGVMLGVAVGVVFTAINLVVSVIAPLLDDSPMTLLGFYGPMFLIWGVAGYLAYRRTGRLVQALTVGATVAFATFAIFTLGVILRFNLLLDTVSQRDDWRNLLLRYQASGFDSLRTYANYEYFTGAPLKILTASTIGAVMGLMGGLVGRFSRAASRPFPMQ